MADRSSKQMINILLVDDSEAARENVQKLLAFEQDFKVIGMASNGREGVERAQELKPDIVIMDINMPDMDGLEAAGLINKSAPTTGVIMMSVQDDPDYLRKAMMAGARDFLSKPPEMDRLYATIRSVYVQLEPMRQQMAQMAEMQFNPALRGSQAATSGERAGHVLVVYSPQGGAGCTTVATNIASGLMKEDIKVLLVDADIQFSNVSDFLAMSPQNSTLVELVESVDDLDTELFDNIVETHNSGLKVLLGPPRPELSMEIRENPGAVATIVEQIAPLYDFVIVDTSTALDAVLMPLLDLATLNIIVTTPTFVSVKNTRFVLDLFEQWEYPSEKTVIVLNRVAADPRKHSTLSGEKIHNFLRREIVGQIPVVEERLMLTAINRGVPIIAVDRSGTKPPAKQYHELADNLYTHLMGEEEVEEVEEEPVKKRGRFRH